MENLTSKNIEEYINNYPTKHKEGFIGSEIMDILEKHGVNNDKFFDALGINTCTIIDGDFITYHCDVLKGLYCVIEDREQSFEEWD
jgi:hypothetical protein